MTLKITDNDLQQRSSPAIKIDLNDLQIKPPTSPYWAGGNGAPSQPTGRVGHHKKILAGIVVAFFACIFVTGTLLAIFNRNTSTTYGGRYPRPLPEHEGDVSLPPELIFAEPQEEKSIADITTLAKKVTVKITTNYGQGTGIALARNADEVLIITNRHVIANAKRIEVSTSEQQQYVGKVVALPKNDVDLTLLTICTVSFIPDGLLVLAEGSPAHNNGKNTPSHAVMTVD